MLSSTRVMIQPLPPMPPKGFLSYCYRYLAACRPRTQVRVFRDAAYVWKVNRCRQVSLGTPGVSPPAFAGVPNSVLHRIVTNTRACAISGRVVVAPTSLQKSVSIPVPAWCCFLTRLSPSRSFMNHMTFVPSTIYRICRSRTLV